MPSDNDFSRLSTSTKPLGLVPATPTVNDVDFPTLEQVEAAKKKASENVNSWANRSKGRLTDIGVYKTGHRYDNIVKYLANFHEKPAILLPKIQRNLKALLNIEMQRAALEYDFHKDLFKLKMDTFHAANKEITTQRNKIVSGEVEPGSSETENRPSSASKPRKPLTIDASVFADYLRGVKGVAHFWRCVFASTRFLRVLCSERDWKILDCLKDVRSSPLESGGFKLEFHFGENDFMMDHVLPKRFEGSLKMDQKRPYKFIGWSVDEISGCEIKWREGMDPTMRKITRHRSDAITQKTNAEPKFVKTKSFFNFFAQPDQESTEFSERILLGTESQIAIGNYFYHKVIPNAVLLLIGETSDKLDPLSKLYQSKQASK